MTIIQYTNPTRVNRTDPELWRCVVCSNTLPTEDEARACAEQDHAKRRGASYDPCLWVSNSGRIACVEHGGGYLKAAVTARPDATCHITPLDHWDRITSIFTEAWERECPDLPLVCEECGP